MSGQVDDVAPGAIQMSGGSSESALKDWQVKPTGPLGVIAVTIVIPVAKCPRTLR
jgi:hypothetical protein